MWCQNLIPYGTKDPSLRTSVYGCSLFPQNYKQPYHIIMKTKLFNGSRTVAHRTIAHRTVAHRTIAHRTVAHRTIAHRTVAHRTVAHLLNRKTDIKFCPPMFKILFS